MTDDKLTRLARGFAQEWLRPDAPEHATEALVKTLSTVMLAFHAVARGVEERAAAAPPRPPAQKSGSEAAYQQPVDDMVTKMAEKLTDESPRYSLTDRIAQWREQAARCRAEIAAGSVISPYPTEGALYLQGREFAFDRCADEAELCVAPPRPPAPPRLEDEEKNDEGSR